MDLSLLENKAHGSDIIKLFGGGGYSREDQRQQIEMGWDHIEEIGGENNQNNL